MSVGEFWPEKYVLKNEWLLNYQQNAPMSNAGKSVSVDHGEPYWTVDVTVTVPTNSEYLKIWSAFFARRKGRRNSFTMNRSFQSFPQDGEIVSDEDLLIAATDRAASTILFGVGGQRHLIREGDMLSYYTEAQGYYCGEVSKALSAALYEVSPPPLPRHLTNPVPRRIKPIGEFRMDGVPSPTETNRRRSWKFSATQVIRG